MTATYPLHSAEVGAELPPLSKEPISEVQLVRYAGASGDFNPIHCVHGAATAAGFEGVVAQGMLLMGFVAQAVAGWVPQPALRKLSVRFTGVTKPGEVITVTGKVASRQPEDGSVRCTVEARNQRGEVKVTGSFEALLPAPQAAK